MFWDSTADWWSILTSFAVTPLLVCAAGVIVSQLLPARLGRLVAQVVGVLLVVSVVPVFRGGTLAAVPFSWAPAYGLVGHFTMPGLSALFVTLTGWLLFQSTLVTAPSQKSFWGWMIALTASVIGVLASTENVLLLYIFFELMLVPIFFLLGSFGGKKRIYAATQFFLFTLLGSVPLLVAILFVATSPTFEGPLSIAALQMAIQDGESYALWFSLALVVPALVKLPAFPLHGWLKLTYAESPLPLLILLVGIVGKVGLFILLHFAPLFVTDRFGELHPIDSVLVVSGLLSILWGALVAARQPTVRGVLTYSSLSHLGFGLLGVAIGTELALKGVVLLMLAHGLAAAATFVIADLLAKRSGGNDDLTIQRALAESAPGLSRWLFLLVLCGAAVPPSLAFVSEFYIIAAAINEYYWATAFWALVGAVTGIVYALRLLTQYLWGKPLPVSVGDSEVPDSTGARLVGGISFVALIGLGLAPTIVIEVARSDIAQLAMPMAVRQDVELLEIPEAAATVDENS